MKFKYYIFNGERWVECGYETYEEWKGKKYRSAFRVLELLNKGSIKVE